MIYVKVNSDEEHESYIIPFNNITFHVYNGIIDSMFETSGDEWKCVQDSNGKSIDIESLKCSSLDALIVELELHQCLYHFDYEDNSNLSPDARTLSRENARLKKQLSTIKKLLSDNEKTTRTTVY